MLRLVTAKIDGPGQVRQPIKTSRPAVLLNLSPHVDILGRTASAARPAWNSERGTFLHAPGRHVQDQPRAIEHGLFHQRMWRGSHPHRCARAFRFHQLAFGDHKRKLKQFGARIFGGKSMLPEIEMNTAQFLVVMARAKAQAQGASPNAFVTAEELLQGYPEESLTIRCYRIAFGIHATFAEAHRAETSLIARQLGRDVSRKPARNHTYLAAFRGQAGISPRRRIVERHGVADPRDARPRITHIRVIPVDRLWSETVLGGVHHYGKRGARGPQPEIAYGGRTDSVNVILDRFDVLVAGEALYLPHAQLRRGQGVEKQTVGGLARFDRTFTFMGKIAKSRRTPVNPLQRTRQFAGQRLGAGLSDV